MTFSIITDPYFRRAEADTLGDTVPVLAAGDIDAKSVTRLRAFVAREKLKSATIYFDSPGGLLTEGMELGRAIRELGFNTNVGRPGGEAICASACTDAYAGGVARFLNDRSGRLGIHQFHSGVRPTRDTEAAVQMISAVNIDYLAEMGVDPQLFSLASAIDAEDIGWLQPEIALQLGLANNGARPAIAEIHTSKMRPYLLLQQEHHDMIGRAIFFCLGGKLSIGLSLITTPETARAWTAGTTLSYVELDGKLALPGADAEASSDLVSFSRALTPDMANQLLTTETLAIRVQDRASSPHGQTIDLRSGHETMRDFFGQCLPGGLPASSVRTRDLVIASLSNQDGRRSATIIDRASLKKVDGRLVRGTAYLVTTEGKETVIFMSHMEFDCNAHRSRNLFMMFYDKTGKATDTSTTDWASVPPKSNAEALLLTACGKTRPADKHVFGNMKPFDLIQLIIGASNADAH
ncbi:hypothetical protein G4G27_13355 [Sphingomonas sp. So64.6b]|uniref:surface-adhesin E family protein n=1 Tax=Sphingomonas sp. So64.6b TaxID=2997354 RepID=UPI0015FF58FE|nr:surface-adhesin E family protein [Sphingomonas sp. So64.6b]QNA84873.1 hypothetical protein G4G27_13355 [Sphingomonas sp. So64.6b]